MVWLIIIVVVGLVFAPAMWLRPSRSQQRMGRLRAAARQAGVAVRLEAPPLHEADGFMAAYRWSYPQRHPGPDFVLVREAAASVSLKLFRDGWRWRIEPLRPLPLAAVGRLEELLDTLPRDAVVLESGERTLTLWWEESLEVEALGPVMEGLTNLRDALSGRPDRPESRPGPPSMPR